MYLGYCENNPIICQSFKSVSTLYFLAFSISLTANNLSLVWEKMGGFSIFINNANGLNKNKEQKIS